MAYTRHAFIVESNRIEGIYRGPTREEDAEYDRFMELKSLSVEDAKQFVSVYQPTAVLRDKLGLDVYVGNYVPPKGGDLITSSLCEIFDYWHKRSPYQNHIKFEKLHPFTDCNGRLGRMFWLWQMREAPLGFLHTFYYQALAREEE